MGCDGGTIPKRHELVRTAKRPPQRDKDMDRSAKWSTCTVSQQALTPPIMTCELGKLYSKESLIEFLLDRSLCESAAHVRTLKDTLELKLTENVGYVENKSELADRYHETQSSKYVCPVVGIEMNGKYKFCALWTCGCVLSDRAIKEVDASVCHNCGTPFTKDDVIVILPEGDDLSRMEENMNVRREKAKALRKEAKAKKNAKRKIDAANFKTPLPMTAAAASSSSEASGKKKKTDKKVENKEEKKNKKKDNEEKKKEEKKDIDVKESKVYKSLFCSSEESKKSKAHWVTYNPYHL